jgi:hypothetical protein
LAAHTIPSPDSLAQTRIRRVVTQIPAAALWLLIIANMLYAILTLMVTIIAWRASNDTLHQVRLRFCMAGLAVALFDDGSEDRVVTAQNKLFHETEQESRPLVKVSIKPTDIGGVLWMRQDLRLHEAFSEYTGYKQDAGTELSTLSRDRSKQDVPGRCNDHSFHSIQ